MIYTVTLNPSLDYITRLPVLTLGETNRSTSQTVFPGGKGINVSRLLSHLDIDNTAFLAFCGAVPFIREQWVHYLVAPAFERGYCPLACCYNFFLGHIAVYRL